LKTETELLRRNSPAGRTESLVGRYWKFKLYC